MICLPSFRIVMTDFVDRSNWLTDTPKNPRIGSYGVWSSCPARLMSHTSRRSRSCPNRICLLTLVNAATAITLTVMLIVRLIAKLVVKLTMSVIAHNLALPIVEPGVRIPTVMRRIPSSRRSPRRKPSRGLRRRGGGRSETGGFLLLMIPS